MQRKKQMGKYSRPEVEYVADEGFVRLNLRRPVNLYVPTELQESYDPTAEGESPSSTLELEWVHGYRGRDCRNNFFPLASGEIIYFAAAVAVIHNPETNTQRHYVEHTDDIKCLAVHPDGKTIATGQIKGREDTMPHVRIWDSETLQTLHDFGEDFFNIGVSCVAFSRESGEFLAAVDDSPQPTLSVWKWEEKEKTAEDKASSDQVIAVTFTGESPPRIVTSGKNHLAFWNLGEDGTDLDKSTAIFGAHERPKYITAVTTLPSGDVISGDSNGNIYIWEQGGKTIRSNVAGAHDGAILNLYVCPEGTVMSAGKDNKLVGYDGDLDPLGCVKEIPEEFGSPRVVFKLNDKFYIGTTNNAIIQTTFEDDHKVITQGHLEELWGMATHHSEPHFVTAGRDSKVYYRNAATHEIVWSKDLEMACLSADIIPTGGHIIVIGGDAGKWVAIDNESQEIIHEGEDGKEALQVMRFSLDGSKLALGSRDNVIYVYDINAEEKCFSKKGQCEGHSSFITHLDWSQDGEMLLTNSGDYEVLCWKVEDCSQVTDSAEYRDVEWATSNCLLAFNSIGIWPPGTDGTHINSCNKAKEKPLMATGDDFGMVKLFAFPARVQHAKHNSYHGHSSHVTNVAFLQEDTLLLSTGGRDTTTMQWKVIEAEE